MQTIALFGVFVGVGLKDLAAKLELLGVLNGAGQVETLLAVLAISTILFASAVLLLKKPFDLIPRLPLSSTFFLGYWLWSASQTSPMLPSLAGFFLAVLLGALLYLASPEQIRVTRAAIWFMRGYLVASIAFTAIVTLGFESSQVVVGHLWAWEGIASHENLLGMGMAMGAILEYFYSKHRLINVWFWLFLLATVATGSYASVISLTIVTLLLSLREWAVKPWVGLRLMLFSVVGLGVSIVIFGSSGRLGSISSALSGREKLWSDVSEIVVESPIFGSGLESLSGVVPGSNAHNDALQALAVGGIVALAFLASAITAKVWESRLIGASDIEPIPWMLLFCLLLGFVEIPLHPSFSILLVPSALIFFSKTGTPSEEELVPVSTRMANLRARLFKISRVSGVTRRRKEGPKFLGS